jgi:hypothetical protein
MSHTKLKRTAALLAAVFALSGISATSAIAVTPQSSSHAVAAKTTPKPGKKKGCTKGKGKKKGCHKTKHTGPKTN